MTDSLLRRGQYVIGPAQRRDIDEALELCSTDPVSHVGPRSHVEAAQQTGMMLPGLWVARKRSFTDRRMVALMWCGATFSVVPDPGEDVDDILANVAAAAVARVPRPASIVGPHDITLDVWGRVEPWWGPARETRPNQPSLVIDGPAFDVSVAEDVASRLTDLRVATMVDYDRLLPAAVHMFTAEVGYDPLRHGRAAYEERLTGLVRAGRSFVAWGDVDGQRDIVFKAEVGIVAGGVAQIQGVWVHPSMRGHGIGGWGMSRLVPLVRQTIAPTVSLYVNDFNRPALAVYRKVGFRTHGTFATVMF